MQEVDRIMEYIDHVYVSRFSTLVAHPKCRVRYNQEWFQTYINQLSTKFRDLLSKLESSSCV